jgi:hypothetical protein
MGDVFGSRPALSLRQAALNVVRPSREARAGQGPRPRGFLAARTVPLVYVNMPKSGCTTIKNILHRIDSGRFLEDPLTIHARRDLFVHWQDQPEEISRRLKTDFVFTFVRHPLKRSYSCFNEKIHFVTAYSFGGARAMIARDYGAVFETAPSLERHRANFKAFLRCARDSFEKRNGLRRDPHWCPQSMVLNGTSRWRMVDFIGRVENFDTDMRTVMALAGLPHGVATPRMNEGPPPPWRFEDVLDDEIREIGEGFFADDLRNFGYVL